MRHLPPPRTVLLALLAGGVACLEPPSGDDPPADTDSPAVDTEDTEVTDPPLPTGDTAPPPPPQQDPAWWGGALVDVSAALDGPDGFPVDPGDPDLPRQPQNTTAFLADLDRDGRDEVITSASSFATGLATAHRVWRLGPAGLSLDAALTDAVDHAPVAWRRAIDLDGDGLLDLLTGEPEALIAWGEDDGSFSALQGIGAPASWDEVRSPGVWDVDRDGWLDLLIPERGCAGVLGVWRQVAPREFVRDTELLDEEGPPGLTDVVGVLPAPDRPHDTVIVSAPAECPGPAHPGFLVDEGAGWRAVDLTPADVYWKLQPGTAGMPFTTVMPMSSLTTDLDDDGQDDVLLTLGDGWIGVLRGTETGFEDATTTSGMRRSFPRGEEGVWFPWGIHAVDLDRDGRKDVVTAVGDDATSFHAFRGIVTTSLAWWNAGDGSFVDATAGVGLDVGGAWHALSVGDLDADGRPDLAFGGFGEPPRIVRNELDRGGGGLVLALRGTTSNPAAYGARVRVEADGLPTQHFLVGGEANPAGTGPQPLFIGLGAASTADVHVTWPTGHERVLAGVTAGARVLLEEAEILALEPANRRAPANGSALVEVFVTPRDAAGALALDAVVALSLDGPGVVLAPPVLEDGRFRAIVRAPTSAGSTRVDVTIDGVPLRVRPRITWE